MTTFGFNAAVQVVTSRYPVNLPIELNNIIHSYTFITLAMIDSHCGKLWDNISVVGLGRLPTSDYRAAPYDSEKQAMISQQRHRSKMMGLWIKNFLITEAKFKLRSLRNSYTFNKKYGLSEIFFVVVKMVFPYTRSEC